MKISIKKLLFHPCLFGHKWSKGDTAQVCLNDGCGAARNLMINKHPKIGESSVVWEYYNINDY